MRSTRASAAVARLNARSEGSRYVMILTGAGLFKLQEYIDGHDSTLCEPLSLDEFVRFVDGLGAQKTRRVTHCDAAFAKQLVKKIDP